MRPRRTLLGFGCITLPGTVRQDRCALGQCQGYPGDRAGRGVGLFMDCGESYFVTKHQSLQEPNLLYQ